MATPKPKIIELSMDEWEAMLRRAQAQRLNEAECERLKALGESYLYLLQLLEDKRTTIDRLRKLLFGATTEKTSNVVPPTQAAAPAVAQGGAVPPREETAPVPGHGRNGAEDYCGAQKVRVPHGHLHPGDRCPECRKGKVYEQASPGVLIRIVGQAPVQAKVYELQKLRCNLCGKVFTAAPPEGVGEEKYDPSAASMLALLKYGTGLPFNRLEGLQGTLGIPLPASTQWDIVNATAGMVEPAYEELIRQAAQGQVLHNDDTTVKVLEFMGKRARQQALAENAAGSAGKKDVSERSGLFTSGIVSTSEGRRIALFFSGRQHAGENLADVLAHRATTLAPPIQMCDALSRNLPLTRDERFASKSDGVASRVKGLPAGPKTILANCLAHGRRQFVDVAERFPQECRYVLEMLAEVYKNDAMARERNLSPEARLEFHQAESSLIMEGLQAWCRRQFDERLVEPNSGLGEAISYLLKHWEKLTLFLRQPGAPLDNNICERALKKAILHRKNALFYKTRNGAHVGDLFMSLIYTCQLCGADPFDYLTQLQRHAGDLANRPENWMPWNYQESSPAAVRT